MTHRWWSRHLAVFVRAALRTSAHSVRSAVSATGLGGVVGNKGGLAISFHLGTTSLAFVSCHLAAHDHKNRERNEMCKEILSETARRSRDAAEMQPRRSRDDNPSRRHRDGDARVEMPRDVRGLHTSRRRAASGGRPGPTLDAPLIPLARPAPSASRGAPRGGGSTSRRSSTTASGSETSTTGSRPDARRADPCGRRLFTRPVVNRSTSSLASRRPACRCHWLKLSGQVMS